MADVVDRATRARMMAGIKGKDTKPEMIVRKALHAAGFRYRLHVKTLPGAPDLVLRKYKTVIFVNGCFWHGHMCHYFKWPQTRPEFWREKILSNVKRDENAVRTLSLQGWRVVLVWECQLRDSQDSTLSGMIKTLLSRTGSNG